MIDWDRVKELRNEIGSEAFEEVVTLFLEEVDEVFAQMVSDPMPEQLEDDLHFLKGSALNLGFGAVAGICREGEIRIRAGKGFDLTELETLYFASRKCFLQDLSTRLDA